MDRNNNKTNIVSEKDGYTNLANAIIIQAVTDYRKAKAELKRNPRSDRAKDVIVSVVRFFRSEWYRQLTAIDGERLISRLNKEVD